MPHGVICLLLVILSPLLAAQEITGKVVSIADGDTLTLLNATREQVKVRLAEIDTPERAQPWGSRARQALSDQVFGEVVRVEVIDIDRYGRTVGRVYLDGQDINRELVRQGHAWVYRQYMTDETLLDDQEAARSAGRGLWGLPEAQRRPPWEWRQEPRSRVEEEQPVGTPLSCGSKGYCREMRSCTEAMFYFEDCGLTRLDGDGDDVPCETLCP